MASKKNQDKQPSLKSASGAGFAFEDKAAATLLCEMLTGTLSLGTTLGIIQKLERQAGDWEPFGDLLLEVSTSDGKLVKCGGSVKSNRQITANGCDGELCAGLWTTMAKTVFRSDSDFLLLLCATLSAAVRDHLDGLCRQARMIDAKRLDQKVVHANVRKIYDSFRDPKNASVDGLPGNALARFIHREFDFEAIVSSSEAAALKSCREALSLDEQSDEKSRDLWMQLCEFAQELRISGGALTREGLVAKLRQRFRLKDDPCDLTAWARIRNFSREGLEEIEITLPGDVRLPRTSERNALRTVIADSTACYVLGDSGSGKSALIKMCGTEIERAGAEFVWIKADRFILLTSTVPYLDEVLARCRRKSGLLVIDALEGCVTPESFGAIARLVAMLTGKENSPWSFIFACQTPDWARVCASLVKQLAVHPDLEIVLSVD